MLAIATSLVIRIAMHHIGYVAWHLVGRFLVLAIALAAACTASAGGSRESGHVRFTVEVWDSMDVDGDEVRIEIADHLDGGLRRVLAPRLRLDSAPCEPLAFELMAPGYGTLGIIGLRDADADDQAGRSGVTIGIRVTEVESGRYWEHNHPPISGSVVNTIDLRDEAQQSPAASEAISDGLAGCGERLARGVIPQDESGAASFAGRSARAAHAASEEADRIVGGHLGSLVRGMRPGRAADAQADALRSFLGNMDLPDIGALQDEQLGLLRDALRNSGGELARQALEEITLSVIPVILRFPGLGRVLDAIDPSGKSVLDGVSILMDEYHRLSRPGNVQALQKAQRVYRGLAEASRLLDGAADRMADAACASQIAGEDPSEFAAQACELQSAREGVDRAVAAVGRLVRHLEGRAGGVAKPLR